MTEQKFGNIFGKCSRVRNGTAFGQQSLIIQYPGKTVQSLFAGFTAGVQSFGQRVRGIQFQNTLTEALNARCEAGEEGLDRFARVLYDQALLTEGSPIPDPAAFARNITELLLGHLKKD